jgi:hypothetical protein
MIALSFAACSVGNDGKSPTAATVKSKFRNNAKKTFHTEMNTTDSPAAASPVLLSLKDNHLPVSSSRTIGEAFDSYKHATEKQWRETARASGQFPYYIDYICWFPVSAVSSVALKEGIVKRGLDIKFAIQEDGETYITMASRTQVKSDGMLHTSIIEPDDIKKIVTAIYENKEIAF